MKRGMMLLLALLCGAMITPSAFGAVRGESVEVAIDTVSITNAPLEVSVSLPWDVAWVGGNSNATIVIADNGTEVKRATGTGAFTWTPSTVGLHTLTYTTLIGGTAQSEVYSVTVYKEWKYTVTGGKATITETTHTTGNVTIPDSLNGYPVTEISANIFNGCSDLTSVTIPTSVTSVGLNAFSGCGRLTSVTMPVGLSCDVSVGGNWRRLSDRSYRSSAIGHNGSTSLSLSLTGPRELAFDWKVSSQSNCDYLRWYYDGTEKAKISGTDGTWQNVTYSIPSGSHTITWTYSKDGSGASGSDCGWVRILNYSFATLFPHSYTNIQSVVLTGTGSKIPAYIFAGCTSLTSVTIPNSVTNIGVSAFDGCSSLASVTIPSSVTSVGTNAFSGCTGITAVSVPWSLQIPLSTLFPSVYGTLTEVTMTGTTTAIAANQFSGCSALESVTIPNTVTSIGASAFNGCSSLTSVTIPASVTSVGANAFSGCNRLTSVTMPVGLSCVSVDGNWTHLSDGSYQSSTIGDNDSTSMSLSLIGPCELSFDLKVSSQLNDYLCWYFDGTEKGKISGTGTTWHSVTCSVPSGFHTITWTYSKNGSGISGDDCGWVRSPYLQPAYCTLFPASYTNIQSVVLTGNGGEIPEYTFDGCTSLTNVTIPSSVTNIGASAFSGCGSLTSVTIPLGVTSVGENAFAGCDALAEVRISNLEAWCGISFANVNANPLSKAKKLYLNGAQITSLVIPSSVTSIGANAFYGCDSLTSVAIPTTVTNVGLNAFSGCTGVTSVTLPTNIVQQSVVPGFYEASFTGLDQLDITLVITNFNAQVKLSAEMLYSSSIGQHTMYGYGAYMYFSGGVTYHFYANYDDYSSVKVDNTVVISPASSECQAQSGTISFSESGWHWIELRGYNHGAGGGIRGDGFVWWTDDDTTRRQFADSGDGTLFYVSKDNVNGTIADLFPDSYATIQSVTISGETATIPNSFFAGCQSLTNFTIPTNVTSIGANAFYGCSSLTSVTIPNSVTSVGTDAFYGCNGLTEVRISNLASWSGISFANGTANPLSQAKKLYLNGTQITNLVIPSGVTSIGANAFNGCSSLTSVTIPNSVTSIGANAFSGCTGVTSVTLPPLSSIVPGFFEAVYYDLYQFDMTLPIAGANSIIKLSTEMLYFESYDWTMYGYGAYMYFHAGTTYHFYVYSPASVQVDNITVIEPSELDPVQSGTISFPHAGWRWIELRGYSSGQGSFVWWTDDDTTRHQFSDPGDGTLFYVIKDNVNITTIADLFPDSYAAIQSVTISGETATIPKSFFAGCQSLTNFTIPTNVTNIGTNAFSGCNSLTSLTIPDGVTSIGANAFSGCSGLTSVTIPPSVTSVGENAFAGCNGLTEVRISDLVAWCGISFANGNANPLSKAKKLYLNGAQITDLSIPSGVTSIGAYVFYGCDSLTSVTIPNSVTSIGANAFSGCSGVTSVTIPWSLNKTLSELFPNSYSKLTNVTMTGTTTSIPASLFSGCSKLTSVTIPDGVTSIGANAFKGCSSLTSVTIPSSVTSVGSDTFYGCNGLTEVRISDLEAWCGISFANVNANPLSKAQKLYLNGAQITELAIPSSVTSIGAYAFNGCSSLTSVTIPASITSVGANAFSGCTGITALSVPWSLKIPLSTLFPSVYRNLTEVTMTGTPTEIAANQFNGCSALESMTIPNSVTSIGASAFNGCSSLTSVTIPASVTSVGANAFSGCTGITAVSVPWSLKIPLSTLFPSQYRNLTAVTMTGTTTEIIANQFSGCSALESVTIPNSVTNIGANAFNGCRSLTNVTIPASVTNVGTDAFAGCNGLTEVRISNLASWFGISFANGNANPLSKAKKLYLNGMQITDLSIPSGVTSIGAYAFYGCDSLTSVTIPNSVTSVGLNAFSGCGRLTSVTMPVGLSCDVSVGGNWTQLSDGSYKSSAIGHNGSTSMSLSLTGPRELSFDWKVSSLFGDYLCWYFDGTEKAKIYGTGGTW